MARVGVTKMERYIWGVTIQQHDNVVVEAAAISAGLRQAQREGEVVRGEREAPGTRVRLPSLPPLYIGVLGGAPAPRDPISMGGGGLGGDLPPKSCGAPPPPPRVSNPRRRGAPRGAHQPTRGWFPSPRQPMGPSGIGGPTRWTPGTLPVVPVQYR